MPVIVASKFVDGMVDVIKVAHIQSLPVEAKLYMPESYPLPPP